MIRGHAIVRAVGPAYRDALGQSALVPAIDLALAQRQHAAYVAALRDLDLDVTELEEGGFADGCFVEDTAVIIGRHGLVTRPGAPSRRAEVEAIHAALSRLGVAVTRMEAPATLDGGDVSRLGDRLLVGRSERTSDAGIAALVAFAGGLGCEVEVVPVAAETLHLKCHMTAPVPGLVVIARDVIGAERVPRGWDIVKVPDDEAYAANTVGRGDVVLVAAGFPRTAAAIQATGRRVVSLDTSEIAKAAGSLTCLSLVLD